MAQARTLAELVSQLTDTEFSMPITKGRRRDLIRSAGIEVTNDTAAEFDRLVAAEIARRAQAADAQRDADRETARAAGLDLVRDARRQVVTGTARTDRELIETIKGHGFKWDSTASCWYRGWTNANDDDRKIWRALAIAAQGRGTEPTAAAKSIEDAIDDIALQSVTPDWSVYRRVMDLARDVRELFDADRHRDVGDVVAFRGAWTELAQLVNESGHGRAAQIAQECLDRRQISEQQAKALATILAKVAAANAPAQPREESAEETVAAPVAPATHTVRVTANSRFKPYVARVQDSSLKDVAFVDRQKMGAGKNLSFQADFAEGDVLRIRGGVWNAKENAFVGPDGNYLVVTADGLLVLTSTQARSIIRLRAAGRDWRNALQGIEAVLTAGVEVFEVQS